MQLEHLTLANVRNYTALEFSPPPGLSVLIGANAQGKSNVLEAIAMLGTGKSFRTARESELVRSGASIGTVAGDARVKAGTMHLACTITTGPGGTRKRYTRNGQSVRYASFLGSVKIVTFSPRDLALVSGGPTGRRALLNEALSIADPRYYRDLVRYRSVVMQKNALLRGTIDPDRDLLETYDAALVEYGTALILARRHYVAALGQIATNVQARFTQHSEALEVSYISNVPLEVPTSDGVADAFAQKLRAMRAQEGARRVALVGPHRDDLQLDVGGQALAAFGSQGQQRTAVLALKVAEYTVLAERTEESPILLLDDVFSELDERRAAAFTSAIGDLEQAFITTTDDSDHLEGVAARFRVEHAKVIRC